MDRVGGPRPQKLYRPEVDTQETPKTAAPSAQKGLRAETQPPKQARDGFTEGAAPKRAPVALDAAAPKTQLDALDKQFLVGLSGAAKAITGSSMSPQDKAATLRGMVDEVLSNPQISNEVKGTMIQVLQRQVPNETFMQAMSPLRAKFFDEGGQLIQKGKVTITNEQGPDAEKTFRQSIYDKVLGK